MNREDSESRRPTSAGRRWLATVAAGTVLAACIGRDDPAKPEPLSACAPPGEARAVALAGAAIELDGPHAIGGAGDVMLQNDRAAFVVQGVDRGISYYHYGGILVDAVAVQDCRQTSDDQFEELGLLLGKLSLSPFYDSTLRAFRATSVEVVADGRGGGPAIVRARGVDAPYWLVEYTLVAEAAAADDPKLLSEPLGVTIEVDYILQPDSEVLDIDFRVIRDADGDTALMAGAIAIFGDESELVRYATGSIDLGGFAFETGIPWLLATVRDGGGAYAFTISDAAVGSATISGVDAVFDLHQALTEPLRLRARGDVAGQRYLFSVGGTDGHSATAPLARRTAANEGQLLPALVPVSGTVVDATSGAPVSGATVDLEIADRAGWHPLDRYVSDAAGRFGNGRVVFADQGSGYRLVPSSVARGRGAPHELGDGAAPLSVTIPPAGELRFALDDGDGRPLPAKLSLYRGDVRTHVFFVDGTGAVPLPPGDYELVISRGFEYERVVVAVTVPPAGHSDVTATLRRIVDTTGYLSIDTHVHSGPSADSKVLIPERVRNAAAEGLEIPVATDHEAIVGLRAGIEETGLGAWVNTITGEEVTATLPEHLTMFPAVPDGTLRGGIVEWYQLGLPELWDAMHERSGGGINILNHPQQIYALLEWDRVAGAPAIDDYSTLQLTKSAAPWSWNFEGVELMNGAKVIFRQPGDDPAIGHFDNWMSFHNHGHRIVGVGASDAHGIEDLGMPRSYFRAPSDDPAAFRVADAVAAFKAGQVLVSAGAFARIVAVDGVAVELGDTVQTTTDAVALRLDVVALPEIDVTHMKIYANCDEVLRIEAREPDELVKYADTVTVPLALPDAAVVDAHLVVAGFGAQAMPRGFFGYEPRNVPRFVTNPIYVDADRNGTFDAPGGKECTYALD